MKISIPTTGDIVKLTKPWFFPLYAAGDNLKIIKQLDKKIGDLPIITVKPYHCSSYGTLRSFLSTFDRASKQEILDANPKMPEWFYRWEWYKQAHQLFLPEDTILRFVKLNIRNLKIHDFCGMNYAKLELVHTSNPWLLFKFKKKRKKIAPFVVSIEDINNIECEPLKEVPVFTKYNTLPEEELKEKVQE